MNGKINLVGFVFRDMRSEKVLNEYIFLIWFQMCKGVSVNLQQHQYVDLGDLSGACLTKISSCTNGGSLSFWIKYSHPFGYAQVTWTKPRDKTGFEIGLLQGSLQ